jgi:hypothetical protein
MDHVQFEIFEDLEFDGDAGTLVVKSATSDRALLRCSVTSIFRHGAEVTEVAEREIPHLAHKADTDYNRSGDKYTFRTDKAGSIDSNDSTHYWYIGLGGHVAVVSVFVDHRDGDDPQIQRVMDCAELLMQTFRRAL